MNLRPLKAFCDAHRIRLEYRYSPRWGMHRLEFMGRHGDGWVKFSQQISDHDLSAIGDEEYIALLIERMERDLLPNLTEVEA